MTSLQNSGNFFFFWRVSLKIFENYFPHRFQPRSLELDWVSMHILVVVFIYLSKSRGYSVPANETVFRNGWCVHDSQVETAGYQVFRSGAHFNVGIFPNSVISCCLYISPLAKGGVCIHFHLLEALYKIHLFPKVVHFIFYIVLLKMR